MTSKDTPKSSSWFRRWPLSGGTRQSRSESSSNDRQFSIFPNLSDELQLCVLSFVADAPYESPSEGDKNSTLTDTLPLVSREFCRMAQSDLLWEISLLRAIKSNEIWKRAADACMFDVNSTQLQTDYKSLYKHIFKEEIVFTGMVFIMGTNPVPKTYDLYFFEPRYVYMVRQLLAEFQEWEENSTEPRGPPPPMYFLHAHEGGLHRRRGGDSSKALLVKMIRCAEMRGGTFGVSLQVDALVSIERYWVAPGTGGLHYASGRRIKLM